MMLSNPLAKTAGAIKEAQADGATLDLYGQEELIHVMEHWPEFRIQLESQPAPSGRSPCPRAILRHTAHA